LVELDELGRVLITAARERRPITYGQLLAFFGRRVTRITVHAICADLGRLARQRAAEGWPDLACLVVRKADGLPGEGYFTSLALEGSYAGPPTGPMAESVLRKRQEVAFAWAAKLADPTP
jgi:hypothetical protein